MAASFLTRVGAFTPASSGGPPGDNLLTKTEAFDNASWDKSGASVTANSATGPLGGSTADTFSPSSHVDGSAGYTQQGPVTITAGDHTFSVYVKAVASEVWISLSIYDSAHRRAWFNISSGAVGTRGAGVSDSTITSVGSGWYRCTLTRTATGSAVYVNILSADADNSEAASSALDYYLWGAQLETGTTATTYNNDNP